jgi:hypothetical protein
MPHPLASASRSRRSTGETPRRWRPAVALLITSGLVAVCFALASPLVTAVAEAGDAPDAADGYVDPQAPISPFDDVPALTRLRPSLRDALRAAARDAEADGVAFVVTSGWRDQRYQDWLRDQAVARGGAQEASEYVAAGTSSRHLSGDAVDIGYTDADSWMQQHGSRYGFCQIYANEMWHYELATTPGGTCPPQYADASSRL